MKQQAGFTLIELVMVIVIIGVLSAVALPKFINLQGDAQQAAVDGVAGALSSASAVNYAARKVNTADTVAVADCDDVEAALQGGQLPTGFNITAAAIAADAVKINCVVNGPGPVTANFTGHGTL
ncbi:MAG: prepilin-type N-terminal cleavage/methylation domain-containing protein [Hydrogenophaga sp.]|uniref:type II secretion system protein n=1 Tax=Hydrogenophaga sp. TaxID=1904254 RepID=UPI0027271F1D|nr:prepilin-type N-terminal cleavage/methylation domain-containing protein [Hydrogenophaga sp.]MDO9031474.1 prepilin-type N-terminal cleavage/methylation domain-containing protein [Hydrogenophaga sp.]